jgi:hypothetical protein
MLRIRVSGLAEYRHGKQVGGTLEDWKSGGVMLTWTNGKPSISATVPVAKSI